MTPDLDKRLRERYPLVFQQPLNNDEPIRTGDGWYHLLVLAFAGLEALIFEKVDPDAPVGPQTRPYRLVCVKEKFGALELYTDNMCCYVEPGFKELYELVWRLSLVTCDVCGKPGKQWSGDGVESPMLIRTRCEEHKNWFERGTGFAHATEPKT